MDVFRNTSYIIGRWVSKLEILLYTDASFHEFSCPRPNTPQNAFTQYDIVCSEQRLYNVTTQTVHKPQGLLLFALA